MSISLSLSFGNLTKDNPKSFFKNILSFRYMYFYYYCEWRRKKKTVSQLWQEIEKERKFIAVPQYAQLDAEHNGAIIFLYMTHIGFFVHQPNSQWQWWHYYYIVRCSCADFRFLFDFFFSNCFLNSASWFSWFWVILEHSLSLIIAKWYFEKCSYLNILHETDILFWCIRTSEPCTIYHMIKSSNVSCNTKLNA